MSSFWRSEKPNDTPIPLDIYVTDFVAGMAGNSTAWAYLLHGYPDHIECWLGALPSGLGSGGLRECLRGAFPDIRCTQLGLPRLAAVEAFPFGVTFSGTPTLKRDQKSRESRADQIEKVCRTLYGAPWAYLVMAERHSVNETIQTINRMTLEIRNTHATYLLKQNAVDENNKAAQRYVELLEKKLERWDLGRVIGMWSYQGWLLAGDKARLHRGAAVLQSAMGGKDSLPDPFRLHSISEDGLKQLIPAPLNSLEMACLTCPPAEEYSGFEIIPPVRFGVETNQSFNPGEDVVRIGAILDRGEPVGTDLRIRRCDLTKHGIIAGVTGAGKTNTCFSLLEQVWNEGKGVPFMVIESAKSEYRALLKNPRFKGLRVFTVGDERISPIRLNPFQVPKGILVQSHIDYLQALFGAAFVLYPPMPYVLAMSIQRVYEEKGWDLTHNRNLRGEDSPSCFPTLDDLIATVRRVSDGMGYEGEIRSNITVAEIKERMAPFWAQHSRLLSKFEGCHACLAPPGEGGCGRLSNSKSSADLDRAARRLLAAYLFQPFKSAETKNVFLRLHRESVSGQTKNDYCFWTEFVETRMSEWGMFAEWTHREVDSIILRLCQA